MNRSAGYPRKHLPAVPYESAMTGFIKTSLAVAAVSTGMLVALACEKPKEEPLAHTTTTTGGAMRALASCDLESDRGTCTDYASVSGSFGVERALCRTARGDFRLKACPARGRIGSCVFEEGEVKRYYEGGEHGFTADAARADCEHGGLARRFETAAR